MANIKAVRHLRVRYIVGLGLLALVVTGSFLAKQHAISVQRNISELINLADQQSGHANRIGYFSLVMVTTDDKENFANARLQLRQTIEEMERVHQTLLHGSGTKGFPLINNANLEALYYDDSVGLNVSLERFLENAAAVYSSSLGSLGPNSYEYKYLTNYGPHALEPLLATVVEEYGKTRPRFDNDDPEPGETHLGWNTVCASARSAVNFQAAGKQDS